MKKEIEDWVEIFYDASTFDESKIYGIYEDWYTFVQEQAEAWEEDFKASLSEEALQNLEWLYNFDFEKFESNLKINFVMGKNGTVFYRR